MPLIISASPNNIIKTKSITVPTADPCTKPGSILCFREAYIIPNVTEKRENIINFTTIDIGTKIKSKINIVVNI